MKRSEKLIANQIQPYTDRQLEDMYCQFLDDVYETVKITIYEYPTSRALALVDPIAFRCGFADYLASEDFEEIDGKHFNAQEVCDFESMEEGAK